MSGCHSASGVWRPGRGCVQVAAYSVGRGVLGERRAGCGDVGEVEA